MTIVKVSRGTSSDRIVATTDSGEKLRMSRLLATQYGVAEGAEITEEAALRAAAAEWAAKDKAVRIAAASNVSLPALKRSLKQKGVDEQLAENAADWLGELGLVDDLRAGESVVRSALAKGYGERRIRQMLFEKQIPREHWEQLLADLPPMDETVDKLLRQRLAGKTDKEAIRKAADALLRFGHSWEDVRAGLRRMQADLEDME